MWGPRSDGIYSVAGPAAAAVLCTVLTQYLSSRQSELCSEALCWMLLPSIFKFFKQSDSDAISRKTLVGNYTAQSAFSGSLWIVAVSIAIASLGKAESSTVGFLPALTPLLLLAQKRLRYESRASRMSDSWLFLPLVNSIWGTTMVALVSILILSQWNPLGSISSVVPVVALLVVYSALTPRTIKGSRFLPLVNIEDAIIPLSSRTTISLFAALVLQTIVFGFPRGKIVPTALLGVAKALSWYFTSRTARYSSWSFAAAMGTFSVMSTRNPFIQTSDFQALSHIAASILSLGQTVHMIPKQAKSRSNLWAFFLVSLVPYLANVYTIKSAQSSTPLSFQHSQEHPVEGLVRAAKSDFADLLQSQSKTYAAAHNEYRRRYNMEPPPGFEAWYEFAASQQSPVIDDFDTIYDSVSPFWGLSGNDILQTMREAREAPKSDMWLCAFSGAHAETRCSHPHRKFDRHIGLLFEKLLGDLPGVLPDVKFLVNHLDEPRVVIPPQSSGVDESYENGRFNMTDLARKPAWDAITKYCSSQQNEKDLRMKDKVETFGLPFVTDPFSDRDLCQHPEYSDMHGLFMSPTSFRLIEGAVPLLSTGSPSTMGDILFPSPAYIESGFEYDDSHDIEWDEKRSNLYWAGSSTGAFASDDKWRYYHRQRFVELAQNLGRQQNHYLRERSDGVGPVESSFLNGRLFDVGFTRIFQCERKYCWDQSAYFGVKSWAHKDQALRSRLVFDIDGNGISGRYYKLLASKSVPLKQTLLREWHDDRLVPWVHYIPVSQSMEELPELVFYLTSTEAGQQRAKEIAEQGREWYSKAFRDVDKSVYTYRLMLELARLKDRKRRAS